MKRNTLIFGLVLGTILCINMIYMVHLCYTDPDFKSNNVVGYATMVVIFSMIFVGVRTYRNNELGGNISFLQAFTSGMYIALIGSTLYVVVWLFYYYLFVPDFLDTYSAHVLKEAAREDNAHLLAKTQDMQSFRQMYTNPIFVIGITYMEVLPIGCIVALASALLLKKKSKKVATDSPYIYNKALPVWIVPISGWSGNDNEEEAYTRMEVYRSIAEKMKINIEFSSRLGTFRSYKNAPAVSLQISGHNKKTFAAYEQIFGAEWRQLFQQEVIKLLKDDE